jgi:hypothetical protein
MRAPHISTPCSEPLNDQLIRARSYGVGLLGEADREAPVRTEPHPTRSFPLPAPGFPRQPETGEVNPDPKGKTDNFKASVLCASSHSFDKHETTHAGEGVEELQEFRTCGI